MRLLSGFLVFKQIWMYHIGGTGCVQDSFSVCFRYIKIALMYVSVAEIKNKLEK